MNQSAGSNRVLLPDVSAPIADAVILLPVTGLAHHLIARRLIKILASVLNESRQITTIATPADPSSFPVSKRCEAPSNKPCSFAQKAQVITPS